MHLLHSFFECLELIIDVSAALVMVLAFAGALVLIRTVIGYFLNKEIEEIRVEVSR
jgi:uncharacterized membrane protein